MTNLSSPPKRLVVDLDGTLTIEDHSILYPDKTPNQAVIEQLRTYKEQGFVIVISSSRNMRRYDQNIGLIIANTVPIIISWLKKHDVPYDEITIGKPWCGYEGFYVDSKALRPDEFVRLPYDEVMELLDRT